MEAIFKALEKLVDEYPDDFDAIDQVGQIFETAGEACYDLYLFGSDEDIKQKATDTLKAIEEFRKYTQQAKKDLKVIKKEINLLKDSAATVDFNRWADEFQIPEDAG